MAPVAFGFMSKARGGLMSGVSPKRCVGVATFVQFRPFFWEVFFGFVFFWCGVIGRIGEKLRDGKHIDGYGMLS